MPLAAHEYYELNRQVEVTWRTLHTIVDSLMVHARVSEACIHFTLIYTTYDIFPVRPIKDLVNEDGDLTTPYKLATGTKYSVSQLPMLFCICVVRKATARVDKKALNMSHQTQKGFCGIFVGITQHQKGFIVYIPSTRKIISSYDFVLMKVSLVL